MRKPLVAGNWKMNGTLSSLVPLIEDVKNGQSKLTQVEVAVCPTYVYIPEVAQRLSDSSIKLGAQDVALQAPGAYTGEVACEMLQDFKCHYVIVGHSERRTIFGETDQIVASKCQRVQESGMLPILCVGELLEERESEQTDAVITRQIKAVLDQVGVQGFASMVVAYEPVWAIGTGLTASPEQAQAVHALIRDLIRQQEGGENVAESLQILYGGSVKPDNAADLFAMPDIDGGLIGGAALKADDFLAICEAANSL